MSHAIINNNIVRWLKVQTNIANQIIKIIKHITLNINLIKVLKNEKLFVSRYH